VSNGKAEIAIVPAIGRVMQFRFTEDHEGPFFENRALDGGLPDSTSKEWSNFGGDKSWPAPQAEWHKMIGRDWPPPASFDSRRDQARVQGGTIDLVSQVEPAYGIREHRRVELDDKLPVMTITTTYEKVSGDPVKVGIGVITQLKEPQLAAMILPEKSRFPDGYVKLNFGLPRDLKVDGRLLSVRVGVQAQIGSDANTLLWIGGRCVVRIDSTRVEGGEYANQDTNAIIYTAGEQPLYVELEPFGPLSTMKVGDRIQRTVKYTLMRRTERDAVAEAKKVLY
jgi:hypothetical protein